MSAEWIVLKEPERGTIPRGTPEGLFLDGLQCLVDRVTGQRGLPEMQEGILTTGDLHSSRDTSENRRRYCLTAASRKYATHKALWAGQKVTQ